MALSPMMRSYLATKQAYPDAILFYRIGDFYEMFFDDAILAARELELTLTGKDCGLEERAPMAGVPWHAAETYIARLIEKGYKVAIGEQLEDPAKAKGLVKRGVVRVVTPGTVIDESQLKEKQSNYLLALAQNKRRAAVAGVDVTTGECFVCPVDDKQRNLQGVLATYNPRELVVEKEEADNYPDYYLAQVDGQAFSYDKGKRRLLEHFKVGALEALGLQSRDRLSVQALGALFSYLEQTQMTALPHITRLQIRRENRSMPLDAATRRNLELTENLQRPGVRGSLLWALDRTCTAMGARELRSYVERPLTDRTDIENRLDAVSYFFDNIIEEAEISEKLKSVYDMERLVSKVSYRTINARDCLALERSLKMAEPVRERLKGQSGLLSDIYHRLEPLNSLQSLLSSAIHPESPIVMTEGGIIRDGFNQQLDGYRQAQREGKQWLLELEAEEREKTGIKNLKVQYNRVFGYHLEVTKSNYHLVPDYFVRRQTLASSERYTTEKLKEIEEKVTGAQEKAVALETELFDSIREEIQNHLPRLQVMASGYKALDAVLSLSKAAREHGYVRPAINEEGRVDIQNGRHPVVEKVLPAGGFVPNDTLMNDDERMLIITGPNMGGKSTYMRQTALIVLMMHMGSFVPAQSADLPLCDNVFTRIGASDDLSGGQSTFMVEMSELSYILRNATEKSLIILDEIGRGTGTFDGLSIAWATVEHLANKEKSGAKTLFATHFHELAALEHKVDGVKNYSVAIKEMGDDVLFLHKIVEGAADRSFGGYVAKLAGVPRSVLARAKEIQTRLSVSDINHDALAAGVFEENRQNKQMSLMDVGKNELVEEISALDVLQMSPIDALNTLFVLREKARKL